jgi:hypothetical protein
MRAGDAASGFAAEEPGVPGMMGRKELRSKHINHGFCEQRSHCHDHTSTKMLGRVWGLTGSLKKHCDRPRAESNGSVAPWSFACLPVLPVQSRRLMLAHGYRLALAYGVSNVIAALVLFSSPRSHHSCRSCRVPFASSYYGQRWMKQRGTRHLVDTTRVVSWTHVDLGNNQPATKTRNGQYTSKGLSLFVCIASRVCVARILPL